VEDAEIAVVPPLPMPEAPSPPQWTASPPPPPEVGWEPAYEPPPPPPPPPPPSIVAEIGSKFDLGAMLNMPGSIRGTLRERLPESIDLGDILLVIVLIYLFLEGDDDDMLIILGVLLFTWIWPLFKRDED